MSRCTGVPWVIMVALDPNCFLEINEKIKQYLIVGYLSFGREIINGVMFLFPVELLTKRNLYALQHESHTFCLYFKLNGTG